jgi:hypothetical protein
MTTTCPKCNGTDIHKAENHEAAHGAHTSLHALHYGWPMLGVLGLIISAFASLGSGTVQVCRKCGHRF